MSFSSDKYISVVHHIFNACFIYVYPNFSMLLREKEFSGWTVHNK